MCKPLRKTKSFKEEEKENEGSSSNRSSRLLFAKKEDERKCPYVTMIDVPCLDVRRLFDALDEQRWL